MRLGVRGTSPQDLVRLLDGWGLQADLGSLARNNRELVEANA